MTSSTVTILDIIIVSLLRSDYSDLLVPGMYGGVRNTVNLGSLGNGMILKRLRSPQFHNIYSSVYLEIEENLVDELGGVLA